MNIYNLSIIELMEFSDWITDKFLEWRGNKVGQSASRSAPGSPGGDVDFQNCTITIQSFGTGRKSKFRILSVGNKTNSISCFLSEIAGTAGVHNAHPHRLRHTFAIAYLRNAGNARFLQTILGHSTADMVNRYLSISEQDLAAAHRTASPVENWRL